MCGIAGFVNKSGDPVDPAALKRMTHTVRHRGPDGEGHCFRGNLALGHRRLAIIDLSDAANQPMYSRDRNLVIVFNGEIYNYIEVRAELQCLGHRFSTSSDTEVILAAYDAWGTECVRRFNGMWAFAIHDLRRNMLFCSRDRFGVKPFYYIDSDRLFAFGSEIKQLLEFLPRKEARADTLLTFLTTGLTDYSEFTFFEGVLKLLPGHNLYIDLASGSVRQSRYYEPDFAESEITSPERWQSRLLETFTSSVELRLRSDVRVGTCLSGGLDSSSIAAVAAPRYRLQTNDSFCAVTAGCIDSSLDEVQHAGRIVQHCGLEWRKSYPTARDFIAAMPEVCFHQEEPFGSPSPVMQYFVMRMARESGIPVMLDGQGADELLLGYNMYYGMQLSVTLRQKGLLSTIGALFDAAANNTRMGIGAALKYAAGIHLPRLWYLRARWKANHIKAGSSTPAVLLNYADATRNLRDFQRYEIEHFTLPALLRFEDRNSMAFAVETRLPFLDFRLVELGLSVPLEYKIRHGWTKWILRRAMAGILPDSILWRKDKIGFEAPQGIWMNGEAAAVRRTIMSSELLSDIADLPNLERSFSRLPFRQQWRLFSAAMWGQQFGVSRMAGNSEDLWRSVPEECLCRA